MDSTDNAKGAFLPSVINRIERCSPVSSQIVEKNLLTVAAAIPGQGHVVAIRRLQIVCVLLVTQKRRLLFPLSFRGPFSSFLFPGWHRKRDDLAGSPMIRPKILPIEGQ